LGAQAVQVNSKDLVALRIVAEIDKLFELDAEAKAAGLGAGERLELRMEKAEPTLKVSRSELNRPERRRSHAALWAKHAITPWAAGFG
jgi:hypothetical protein